MIEEAISAWTSERDEWEAAALLQQARVPASPAEHVGDIVERDAGMRQFFYEFKWGELPFQVQTQPFTWNGARLETTPSPKLGEHNEEILRGELGLDEERFVDLMVREVVY